MARERRIELLTEDNFDTWIIDARALLRKQKLWNICQSPLPANAAITRKEMHIEAADELILIISSNIKVRLTDAEQNDGYLLLTKLREINTPATDQVFYTSCQELLTLQASGTDLETFLARIKTLNEKIDATKIELNSDRRTLLVLMLGLGPAFETLVQIWATTPDLTADKAIRQLRAKERRIQHRGDTEVGFIAMGQKRRGGPSVGEPSAKRVATASCNTCSREHPGVCWSTLTCDYCKRKGHPLGRCYDNPESPVYKGSQSQGSDTAAIFVTKDEVDENGRRKLWS
jgi:hypothetical protein